MSLMLACLGTHDLITVFFSVSWQTVYRENANAVPFLSPHLLLLLKCTVFFHHINGPCAVTNFG